MELMEKAEELELEPIELCDLWRKNKAARESEEEDSDEEEDEEEKKEEKPAPAKVQEPATEEVADK